VSDQGDKVMALLVANLVANLDEDLNSWIEQGLDLLKKIDELSNANPSQKLSDMQDVINNGIGGVER